MSSNPREVSVECNLPESAHPKIVLQLACAAIAASSIERAALCGVSEGGPMCSLFAATYPEKTLGLVMFGTYAKRIRDEQYPWGPSAEEREHFLKRCASIGVVQ